MSKRRKYDGKNKRSFIIIIILSVLVVAIFSLFIYKYTKTAKIEYKIEPGSVLQDVDRNYLTIDDDAKLKIRWNGNYYLVYNDEKINLGKKVIVYNGITAGMKLYGKFYEITKDGKVIENKNETVLSNTSEPRFYKIDDREYLLVANKINSSDYSIEASNYLLVELDKAGNAKLSNDRINLKTISPTQLITSVYNFDINNEILNFGELNIDLKKIIGSTNQYTEEAPKVEEPNDSDNNPNEGATGEGGTGTGAGGGGGFLGDAETPGAGDIINSDDTGEIVDLGELMSKIKMTSIIRIVEGITTIDIDYVVYDPYNEYGDVYVEVIAEGANFTKPLPKNETHITLDKLEADKNYNLRFVYSTNVKDPVTGEVSSRLHTFEEFSLRTKVPEYSLSIYKLSRVKNQLEFKVDLQKDYKIDYVNVEVSFDNLASGDSSPKTISVPVDNNSKYVTHVLDIADYDMLPDSIIRLTVKSIIVGKREIPINSTYMFRFGGNDE